VTARKPCGAWREGVSAHELFVGTFLRLRAGAIAWEVEAVKTRGLARWCETLKSGIVAGGPDEAKLAAEDAARDLLLGGLAVLAPGMPEGWRIERFKSSIVLRDPEDVGVFVGSEAKADALALGMLAAVRK